MILKRESTFYSPYITRQSEQTWNQNWYSLSSTVESHFDRFAISVSGARGLMQVMPFWLNEINLSDKNLFKIRTNLRMGCTSIRRYLDRESDNLGWALLWHVITAVMVKQNIQGKSRMLLKNIGLSSKLNKPGPKKAVLHTQKNTILILINELHVAGLTR